MIKTRKGKDVYNKLILPCNDFCKIKEAVGRIETLIELLGHENTWSEVMSWNRKVYLTDKEKNIALLFHYNKDHHVNEISIHKPLEDFNEFIDLHRPSYSVKLNRRNTKDVLKIIQQFENLI